ncbi:Protease HtpX [Stieleria bergensis]|uniref:Protease HtpX n=1 Tax=Stieleria bergensis TaxID=2528025 RepID=A0A517SQY1_9BACT|nr:Protease HtpX [Planctomycetes bacterium SV_7m_r]
MQDQPFSFTKSFVLPAFLLFLIPLINGAFFYHAQSSMDDEYRNFALKQIATSADLTAEQKTQLSEVYRTIPLSTLAQDPEFAAELPSQTVFDLQFYRWSILTSVVCVVSAVGMIVLGLASVVVSLRSQRMQYLSMKWGWNLLRLFCTFQTIAQMLMLVSLSYWVTALWMNIFIPKLIFVVGLLALGAIVVMIKGIFTRIDDTFAMNGTVIGKNEAAPLWQELSSICNRVGTEPPDQIVAGIDDSFFVTEHPITLTDQVVTGRSLYVSLSLLKHLKSSEADAILAHEMAHFSGDDTTYSKKIGPLLTRFDHYLNALYQGGITMPVYLFMLCFRGLYELTLGHQRRQREFRADRIATEVTSANDLASGMLRLIAFSTYRASIENKLFDETKELESIDISQRIEEGFTEYAATFVQTEDLRNMSTSHPFDSHPPLDARLQAVGTSVDDQIHFNRLSLAGDGRWYHLIGRAEQAEREQWDAYEEEFRQIHQTVLAYRYLPNTDAEREFVERQFPPVEYDGKKGTLSLDCLSMNFSKWKQPVRFADVNSMTMNDNTLIVAHKGGSDSIVITKLPDKGQEAMGAIENYYGRYLTASDYAKSQTKWASSDAT